MELHVIKKADDRSLGAKVLRLSIGGDQDGAYLTYRGDLDEVQQLLRKVTKAFMQLEVEPPVSPDEGKRYA